MKNKKHVIISLIVLIIVASCFLGISLLNNEDENTETPEVQSYNLTITTPAGAPSLALAGVLDDDNFNVDYEVVDGSEPLSAEFMADQKDLIIAPINLGLKLIDKGANYKLISVLTWGNLQIVGDQNNYGTIAAFGEGAVPGVVLESVHNLIGADQEFEYFASVQEAASMFLNGDYHAVMLAEPMLTKVKKNYAESHNGAELYDLYNIQDLYEKRTGFNTYPQAALFVRNDVMSNEVDKIVSFTSAMASSISTLNEEPAKIANLNVDFEKLGFANVEMLTHIYPKMAVNFVYTQDCFDEINAFLALFGTSLGENSYVK